jgi:hypothetical protein
MPWARAAAIAATMTIVAFISGCGSLTTRNSADDMAVASGVQTIGFADAMQRFTAACGTDLEKYCRKVPLGGGQIQTCLAQNASKLSQTCAATYIEVYAMVERRLAAQAAAAGICESDAKRLCANFRQGQARVLRCLIREDNARRVSRNCNRAITDAGWR